uniref:ZP domain-containing protein n=2 Tax=Plectus sambesii TaxID=2011161 RepID=A0A914WMY4_9BILA
MQLSLVCLALCVASVVAIPIDNGVEGEPEIECGSTSITISFNTQNNFEGHVYVKGRYAEPGCRNDENGRQTAGISLDFSACGVKRTRSENPKGVFVETTVIISFHPLFETKIDRAYRIQCFYMEADKTVSQELEVSMLTTGFATEVVPMPICRYEILEGGPSGAPIRYALIGQQVYHKWTCDTETVNTFCMLVHSCFVDDGQGDRVDLLTAEGCGIDKNLLNNLEYPTDLMAGQEAHVFKYADRANLYFNCQITITIKEPNGACPLPVCPEPNSSLGRKRRSAKMPEIIPAAIIDVATSDLEVLDLDSEAPVLPNEALHRVPLRYQMARSEVTTDGGVCMSAFGFAAVMAITLVTFASAAGIFVYSTKNKK